MPVQQTRVHVVPISATRSGEYDRVMRTKPLISVPTHAAPRPAMAVFGRGGEFARRNVLVAGELWYTPPPPHHAANPQLGPATITMIADRLSPILVRPSATMSSGSGGEFATTRASGLILTMAWIIPNTASVDIPTRYTHRGAPPRAETDTINRGQYGADALLGTHLHVLDFALAQAKPAVLLGLLGFAERVGPSDAVDLIDWYTDTQAPGSPGVRMKRLQKWWDRRGVDRGAALPKLANLCHVQTLEH